MKKSESIIEISKALAKFQEQVKQPFKDADNPFFKSKYVPLESVVEVISQFGPKNGLSFTQWALNDDNGRVGVATLLMHTSGEYIEFDPVFMSAEKNTPQGAGALITYLKRYTLSAIYGITSDADDDGNSASGNDVKSNKSSKITSEQVGGIKTKALQFAQARNGEVDKVYEALNIKSLTNLTATQADAAIKKLNNWLANAK